MHRLKKLFNYYLKKYKSEFFFAPTKEYFPRLRRGQGACIILFTTLFLFNIPIIASQFTKEDISRIYPSESRIVYNLSGNWKMLDDGKEWVSVELPKSFSENKQYEFSRAVKIASGLGKKMTWHIHFMGVQDRIQLYINEEFEGTHFGGMTDFSVRIPVNLIEGDNMNLRIVTEPLETGAASLAKQNLYSYKTYNGIVRDILLIGTPKAWISGLFHNVEFGKSLNTAQVTAKVNISTAEINGFIERVSDFDTLSVTERNRSKLRLEMNLLRSNGDIVLSPESIIVDIESERTISENVAFTINNPSLWSPDVPEVYYLEAKLTRSGTVIDDIKKMIAFKDIRTVIEEGGNKLYLNGKPLLLKGVAYIEDYMDYGYSYSAKQMEQDIRDIKTLGANLVRFKYNPPNPYLAYLCSREGLLMTVELPVYDAPLNVINRDEIKVRLKNLISRLYNSYSDSPALLAWGISDGIRENVPEYSSFTIDMIKEFNSFGTGRFFKIAPLGTDSINTDGFDFIGIKNNRNTQNFTKLKEQVFRLSEQVRDIPAFFSFGTIINPDNNSGYSDQLSKEFQAFFLRNSYYITRDKRLAGCIVNTYNDYSQNYPLLRSNYSNLYIGTSGIVNEQRQKRLAYNILRALFNKEKEPLLNAGSFTESSPVSFILIGLFIGVILAFFLNRFRRFREYLLRSLLRPYNFYADIRDQRIMSSFQTVVLGIAICLTFGIYTGSVLYFFRYDELTQYILMIIIPSVELQESLFRTIWMPELLMLIISVNCFVVLYLLSFMLRIFAFFLRARVFFTDAMTISIWSAVPYLLLLPIAFVLIRILVIWPDGIWAVLALQFLIKIWVLLRFFRSSAVVFDIPSYKVYITGFGLLALCIGIPLAYYQYKFAVFDYARYFAEVLLR